MFVFSMFSTLVHLFSPLCGWPWIWVVPSFNYTRFPTLWERRYPSCTRYIFGKAALKNRDPQSQVELLMGGGPTTSQLKITKESKAKAKQCKAPRGGPAVLRTQMTQELGGSAGFPTATGPGPSPSAAEWSREDFLEWLKVAFCLFVYVCFVFFPV